MTRLRVPCPMTAEAVRIPWKSRRLLVIEQRIACFAFCWGRVQ